MQSRKLNVAFSYGYVCSRRFPRSLSSRFVRRTLDLENAVSDPSVYSWSEQFPEYAPEDEKLEQADVEYDEEYTKSNDKRKWKDLNIADD